MNQPHAKPWRLLSWPNRISLLRLLLVPPFVILMLSQPELPWARHAAIAVFLLMAASDAIDGYLARRLGDISRLGAILDPLADKTLILCAAILLALPASRIPGAPLPLWIAVLIVGKDLWVIGGFTVVYLVTDRFRVHPTIAGKLSTFAQAIMVTLTLIAPDLNRLSDGLGTWTATVLMYTVAATSIAAAISYTRVGLLYVIHEQQPLDENHLAAHEKKHKHDASN